MAALNSSGTTNVAATATVYTVKQQNGGAGLYDFYVDLNAMANGDVLVFTVEWKAQTADTVRKLYTRSFGGPVAPDEKIVHFPAEAIDTGEVTLKVEQTAGTAIGNTLKWWCFSY